ncbi:unnamed protein product [Caenorhabditis brenneri]
MPFTERKAINTRGYYFLREIHLRRLDTQQNEVFWSGKNVNGDRSSKWSNNIAAEHFGVIQFKRDVPS